jgi:hypothetical protein
MENEHKYEAIDRAIMRSMLSATNQYNRGKMQTEPWPPEIGLATNKIWYWDARIKHKGDRNAMSGMLIYYLPLSDVEVDCHDKAIPLDLSWTLQPITR